MMGCKFNSWQRLPVSSLLHIKITCFPYPQLPTCIINQFVFTTSPESTIKRLSWYVIILLCQIIYGALDTQILLIKYCDYLSMSYNLYGARETNIVLIILYTLWLCDHFPYPYGFLILYGSTEINDMIWYDMILSMNSFRCDCNN